jgi:hypothetical protein
VTVRRAGCVAVAMLFVLLLACVPQAEESPTVTPPAEVPTVPVLAETPTETAVRTEAPVDKTVPTEAPVETTVPTEASVETTAPTETPAEARLSPQEAMEASVEKMSGVTSAHFVFQKEVVGSYTMSGEGVLLLPDRAHFEGLLSYDQAPVETIIIGATGYWVDESLSSGWSVGPIAPFVSNPARWVELLEFYESPTLVGQEMLNGVDCYHLQFAVTFEPGWMGLFSGGGTGEAWISTQDFSLAKAVYAVEYEGVRESGSLNLSFELSDLDEPVIIEAPT